MTTNQSTGKIKASRVNNLAADTYIGPEGQIWYDTATGVLRLGDNVTPGGTIIGGGGGNGTPSGPNASIQFNNNGVFGGNSALTFDAANSALILSGAISATGNVTGNFILGNGSMLTGIVSSNVDLGNISQDVIPAANITYSLGNATNQWKDLWISNSTIYINSIPLSVNTGNDLLFNNVPVVTSSNTAPPQTANIATTANVVAGNIVVSNATPNAGVTFSDGTVQYTAAISSNYGDSNVVTLLSSFGSNTVSTTGNVTAGAFVGDGSLLTNLPVSNTIINGTSNVSIPVANGSVFINSSTGAGSASMIEVDPYLNINLSYNGNQVGYLGFDTGNDFYISDAVVGGNIILTTQSGSGTKSWTLGADGNLHTPQGGYIGPAGVKGDGTMITGGPGNITSLTSYYSSAMYSSCVTANPDGTLTVTTYGDGTGVNGLWTFTGANLNVPGEGVISTANAVSGLGGNSVTIQAGASDAANFNGNPGGNLNLVGGYGSFGDGGGGPGGNVNIASGGSSDSHAGNVNINAGTNTWIFSNGGNLTLPDGSTIGEGEWYSNNGVTLQNHDSDFSLQSSVSASASGQAAIHSQNDSGSIQLSVTTDSLNNVITIVNNAETWTFGTDGNLTIPGAIGFNNSNAVIQSIGPVLQIAGNIQTNQNILGLPVDGGDTFLSANANVNLLSGIGGTNYEWSFGVDGNLTLPGIVIGNVAGNIVSGSYYAGFDAFGDFVLPSSTYFGQGANLGMIVSANTTGAVIEAPASGQSLTLNTNSGAPQYNWVFDATGTLTLPQSNSGTAVISAGTVGLEFTSNGHALQLGTDGNLAAPGNISAAGNVYGAGFAGDGTDLANVSAIQLGNSSGAYSSQLTIDPYLNFNFIQNTSGVGNIVGYMGFDTGNDLYVSSEYGNIIFNTFSQNGGGTPITFGVNSSISTVGNVLASEFITPYSTLNNGLSTTGNVVANNINTSSNISAVGNITASYFIGNGSQLTGLPAQYGNSNVANYLPTYAGNLQANNISITGNAIIQGNLSVAGNITFTNSNVVVTEDLYIQLANNQNTTSGINGAGFQVGQGNLVNWTYSNFFNAWTTNVGITANGNISAPAFYGNGYNLSNINAGNIIGSYGNSNVANYLANGNDPTILSLNSAIGNTNSNVANTNSNVANTNSNVVALTNNTANSFVLVNSNVANTNANVVVLTNNTANSFANTNSNVANNASNITTLQANVISLSGNVYANANVAAYLPTYTGNLTAGNISVTGNITGNYFVGNGSQLSGVLVSKIANGTSNVNIASANGSITMAVNGNSTFNLGANIISIGANAGQTNQGSNAVAIGQNAGSYAQGSSVVAIGQNAGNALQGSNSVAIGVNAANVNQGGNSIAIGNGAAANTQGNYSVAIGAGAGTNSQSDNSVAIGQRAGNSSQGGNTVGIGLFAGFSNQGANAIGIGRGAGEFTQGIYGVAIGGAAGVTSQGNYAVAVGGSAGFTNQGANTVAIGLNAGFQYQGANSVAIGAFAGYSNAVASSIIINASGNNLNSTNAGLYINPVRNDTGNITNSIYYNTSTNELTYAPASQIDGEPEVAPILSSLTAINQGSATFVQRNGYISMLAPQSNGDDLHMLVQNMPPLNTAWNATLKMNAVFFYAGYDRFGICLYDTVAGKVQTYGMMSNSTTAQLELANWSSPTAYTGLQAGDTPMNLAVRWFRINCTGTNLNYQISADGYQWLTTYTIGINSNYLNPNRVGFFIYGVVGVQGSSAAALSWTVG